MYCRIRPTRDKTGRVAPSADAEPPTFPLADPFGPL
jgi:hypothetical protein